MWRLEARPAPSRAMSYASPVIALVMTVVVAFVMFVALGADPVRGLQVFLIEPWNGARALSELALKSTSLVLCALGLALCYRSNVWNIGAEGQYLMGGIAAGGLAMWFTMNKVGMSNWAFMPLAALAIAVSKAAFWPGWMRISASSRIMKAPV